MGRIVKHWNRLPTETMGSLSQSKDSVDKHLPQMALTSLVFSWEERKASVKN